MTTNRRATTASVGLSNLPQVSRTHFASRIFFGVRHGPVLGDLMLRTGGVHHAEAATGLGGQAAHLGDEVGDDLVADRGHAHFEGGAH